MINEELEKLYSRLFLFLNSVRYYDIDEAEDFYTIVLICKELTKNIKSKKHIKFLNKVFAIGVDFHVFYDQSLDKIIISQVKDFDIGITYLGIL